MLMFLDVKYIKEDDGEIYLILTSFHRLATTPSFVNENDNIWTNRPILAITRSWETPMTSKTLQNISTDHPHMT